MIRWPPPPAPPRAPLPAPSFCWFLCRPRSFLLGGRRRRAGAQPLGEHGLHPGDLPSGGADLHGVLELVGDLLHTELEQVLLQLPQRPAQLVRLVAAEILGLQPLHRISSRPTNRVCTDSLCSA